MLEGRGVHRRGPGGAAQGWPDLRVPGQRRALGAGLHPRPLPHRARARAGRAGRVSPGRAGPGGAARTCSSTTPSCWPPRSPRRPRSGTRRRNTRSGLGARAGARRVVLAHHKPDRTDADLDQLAARFAPGGPGARGAWRPGPRAPGRHRRRRGRDTRSMSPVPSADAIVVGSGPNGLAAAITLARAGLKVQLIEGSETPGGGCRTAELTLPGFQHDVCSAVHPLAASSPFFTSIDLAARGVTLCTPKVAFAHPQDGGRAAAVAGSVEETAGSLGPRRGRLPAATRPAGAGRGADPAGDPRPDPVRAPASAGHGPLRPATACRPPRSWPGGFHRGSPGPVRRGRRTLDAAAERPGDQCVRAAASRWWRTRWAGRSWKAAVPGSPRRCSPSSRPWAARCETGHWVRSLDELPPARAVLLDVTPRQLIALAGDRLSGPHQAALRRFRYGPGVCKVDFALSGPSRGRPRPAGRRAPSISAGRWPRWPAARRT